MDVMKVADSLIDHIQTDYPNDIALVAYYGSYAQGTATKRSDLDFFFIPATDRGYQVSLQFIVGDISFDFWPISWERAERMARLQEPQTTIIADCKLLYVRSEEDGARFMKLRDTIRTMTMPENAHQWVEIAQLRLRDAWIHLHKTDGSKEMPLAYVRMEAHGVLNQVLQALALLNGGYFTKGFGKNFDQIFRFRWRPADLESHMKTILYSHDPSEVVNACRCIVEETRRLSMDLAKRNARGTSYPDRMRGFYEEEKGILDKIRTACENQDYNTAFFYSIHAQQEIAHFLYYAESGLWPSQLTSSWDAEEAFRRYGLPNLVDKLDPNDFDPLHIAVEKLTVALEFHLTQRGVVIHRFDSVEEFDAFLDSQS